MEKIKDIILKHGVRADKRFGQNFLTDTNLLDAIVSDAGIDSESSVLEIGAGTGALTSAIARKAKRVVSIEIDGRLENALRETVSGYDNVTLIFGDILKINPREINERMSGKFDIVANLPYYITTPIIFYFLENAFDINSITIMVQREVGDRITAKHNTKDYGALTAAVWLYAEAKITRNVPRQMFFPSPDVDSCVVRLKMRELEDVDKKSALRLVKCAFSMRRKTLINNIMMHYDKTREQIEAIFDQLSLDYKVRGESLSPMMLAQISKLL